MYETFCYNQWGLESHLELSSPTNCGLTVGVSEKKTLIAKLLLKSIDWLGYIIVDIYLCLDGLYTGSTGSSGFLCPTNVGLDQKQVWANVRVCGGEPSLNQLVCWNSQG